MGVAMMISGGVGSFLLLLLCLLENTKRNRFAFAALLEAASEFINRSFSNALSDALQELHEVVEVVLRSMHYLNGALLQQDHSQQFMTVEQMMDVTLCELLARVTRAALHQRSLIVLVHNVH